MFKDAEDFVQSIRVPVAFYGTSSVTMRKSLFFMIVAVIQSTTK